MKLGRRSCLVLNINLKPRGWGKEQVRLVTEGGQMWLQGFVTMHKLSLPLQTSRSRSLQFAHFQIKFISGCSYSFRPTHGSYFLRGCSGTGLEFIYTAVNPALLQLNSVLPNHTSKMGGHDLALRSETQLPPSINRQSKTQSCPA